MYLIDKRIEPSQSYANFFHACNLMDRGRETVLVGLSGRRLFSPRVSRAPYIFQTPATQAVMYTAVSTKVVQEKAKSIHDNAERRSGNNLDNPSCLSVLSRTL